MKIPLSWLREFAELPSNCTPELIESAFVKVGFEVEDIQIQGADLTGPLVVARVESIEELADLKKPIRYVGLDCGEGSVRYVICGATNFAVGDLIVAALPGAVLPGNFSTRVCRRRNAQYITEVWWSTKTFRILGFRCKVKVERVLRHDICRKRNSRTRITFRC